MDLVADIEQGALELGVELSPGAAGGLASFAAALVSSGRERGVTSLRESGDVVRELILDSLATAPYLPRGGRIGDLGSGGGVPGLPLALVRPDLRLVLVESLGRKVAWLKEQVGVLGLGGRVEVLPVRAEDMARDTAWRGGLDGVVAKALASLPVLVELGLPLLRVGACLYAYKGPAYGDELNASVKAFRELRGSIVQEISYRVGDRARIVCVVRKEGPTPDLYPRRAGIPERKPL